MQLLESSQARDTTLRERGNASSKMDTPPCALLTNPPKNGEDRWIGAFYPAEKSRLGVQLNFLALTHCFLANA